MKKRRLWILLFFLPALYPLGVILYATVYNYQPEGIEPLSPRQQSKQRLASDQVFDIVSWNIGYGGMGDLEDFFFDGGSMSYPDSTRWFENWKCILTQLERWSEFDFILLQEVDSFAQRSHFHQQLEDIAEVFPGKEMYYASNYKVPFVPLPWLKPMGRVHSGLVSISSFKGKDSERHTLPGSFSWPTSLFMLDRCLLVQSFSVSSDKELIIINAHLSTFDGGTLKHQEMKYLKELVLKLHDQGHFIIVGGDWNQHPAGFNQEYFAKTNIPSIYQDIHIPLGFMPIEWKWIFDSSTPTNRDVAAAYHSDSTYTSIIDFFLVSPNIDVLDVTTFDLQFRCSDHHPVSMKFRLKR